MARKRTQPTGAMFSRHEVEMSQAATDPGCLPTDRSERRAVFRRRQLNFFAWLAVSRRELAFA
jgi:hypothetical protein